MYHSTTVVLDDVETVYLQGSLAISPFNTSTLGAASTSTDPLQTVERNTQRQNNMIKYSRMGSYLNYCQWGFNIAVSREKLLTVTHNNNKCLQNKTGIKWSFVRNDLCCSSIGSIPTVVNPNTTSNYQYQCSLKGAVKAAEGPQGGAWWPSSLSLFSIQQRHLDAHSVPDINSWVLARTRDEHKTGSCGEREHYSSLYI